MKSVNQTKTTLYIAMSEDGYIAGENDSLDFLNPYQVEGEDYGYHAFIEKIDAIIVGRKTYETVINLGYPYHPEKKVYVITRDSNYMNNERLEFYNGSIPDLANQLKSQNKNVYCDGGAQLSTYMISQSLIDAIILSVIPVTLESGTLLFKNGQVPESFRLKSSTPFSTGLTQFHYELNR